MKADISKDTFVEKKHFRDVRMQQGRVLLSSDWNEQVDIVGYRSETITKDIIGQSGTPMDDHDSNGFKILPAAGDAPQPTLTISAGHYYVDGILCENETDVLFNGQPDFNGESLQTGIGSYIIYLEAWLRNITAVEDPSLREVALNGPDTTTRSKIVWQVKSVPVTDAVPSCANSLLPSSVTDPSAGKLGVKSEASTGADNPCGLVTTGGYKRLENQLYRVEIHNAGEGIDRAETTFKWSRDNGSILTSVEKFESTNKITVTNAGRDELLSFKKNDWVELVNDATDLRNWPGILVQLSDVKGNVLTINTATIVDHKAIGLSTILNTVNNPRVRRWDSAGEISVNMVDDTWIELEDGIMVSFFQAATEKYHIGDYWLTAARTAAPRIDFTTPQLPLGIKHHFAKLAIADLTAAGWSVRSDCRPVFPPATQLTSLYYVGGDGQEAMPNGTLPSTLKVGVANGQHPVENARVLFDLVTAGGGVLTPLRGSLTDSNGIAECTWQLGISVTPGVKLEVRARLLDDGGQPVQDLLPVIFNASTNVADNIYYDGGNCTKWDIAMPTTVASALTSLCSRGNKKGCSISVGKGAQYESLEEAYETLKEGDTELCICLLPQVHKITKPIFDKINLTTLKIAGCGATIEVGVESLTFLAEEIIFQGFTLLPVKDNKRARVIIKCEELHMDYCVFTCLQNSLYKTTPFIQVVPQIIPHDVKKTPMPAVHLNNNKFYFERKQNDNPDGRMLALGFKFGGWIKNNIVEGDMLLQYNDDKSLDLNWGIIPANQAAMEKAMPFNLKLLGEAVLNICNNILFRIQTIATTIMPDNQLPPVNKGNLDNFLKPTRILVAEQAFENLLVSENVFNGFPNSFIANSLTMTDNHFSGANDVISTYALGYKGVFIGNIGENSDGGINAVFNRKISDKALNLIKVQ